MGADAPAGTAFGAALRLGKTTVTRRDPWFLDGAMAGASILEWLSSYTPRYPVAYKTPDATVDRLP